jgi:poly(ADP-ribose) glycohydrolase ARH3
MRDLSAASVPPGWLDRVRGCLLGGALGDALGAPFEGSPRVTEQQVTHHLRSSVALTWTDDTALQLATADYLAGLEDWRSFDDDEHARALARAWAREPDRGYGSSPPSIFATVLDGGDWRAAARTAFSGTGSLGNGGAMRAAPLGALPAAPETTGALARRMAAVTHAHPIGLDGAVLVALTARTLLRLPRSVPPDAPRLVGECGPHLRTTEVGQALLALPGTVQMADPVEVARITGHGVSAQEAACAALAAFLHHPEDPVAAIAFAVRMGGDTDTIAAIAGSLGGAAAGASALPRALLERLELLDRIEDVAMRLATRSHSVEVPVPASEDGQ